MRDQAVPYWFLFGFFTAVCWLIAKWIEYKFFKKEDKWSGDERRTAVVIDESIMKRGLEAYEKHVQLVERNSDILQRITSVAERTDKASDKINDSLEAFIYDFKKHHKLELENQELIKQIIQESA